MEIQLDSELSCPECGHHEMLTMPTDSCLWFHECAACHTLLRPKPGDCCVFCSFGTIACPPIQLSGNTERKTENNCCG